jgi:hypothetical protein
VSYCQQKNRLIAAHAEAVNEYLDAAAKGHQWDDLLISEEPSSVEPEVTAARVALDVHRNALDTHTREHGCGTSPVECAGTALADK